MAGQYIGDCDRERRAWPPCHPHAADRRRCADVRASLCHRTRLSGVGRLARWPLGRVCRARAGWLLSDLHEAGCRRPGAGASDHRSLEQDAAGVVAGRPARRVHGLELRRDVLVVQRTMSRSIPEWFPRSIQIIAGGGYDGGAFLADVISGMTVGLVALPLAMAFAIASGLTPQAGIYCAIITGFLISALGGSRFQIGGPTGAFVVVVAGIVARYGIDGLFMCTLMAGVILVVAGLFGFGTAVRFIPRPVVVGFTNGIALVIASTQTRD